MRWKWKNLPQDCMPPLYEEKYFQSKLYQFVIYFMWQYLARNYSISWHRVQNWCNTHGGTAKKKCPWSFMYLTIIPCENILCLLSFFFPDPVLEYDSLHLTVRVFLNLTQHRNRTSCALWEDGQSGLSSLESHCSFLEVVELKVHHIQQDFMPFLTWQVFLSGLFLPSHAYYCTMIVYNFLLGSFLHEGSIMT